MSAFVLCADDFALSETSSQGILKLLAASRLSAVSTVVNTALWQTYSTTLLPYLNKVDIGLHFNLTDNAWLTSPKMQQLGLAKLIVKSYLGQLSEDAIYNELKAQIEAWTHVFGRLPDFIDGHQHIQQLPVIRDAIIRWFNENDNHYSGYLRCSHTQIFWHNHLLKRFVINRLGAAKLKKLINKNNIKHNLTFSGIYDFSNKTDYRKLFQGFLKEICKPSIIMCHPAYGIDNDDPHNQARNQEFAYFMSDAFVDDCKSSGMTLSRGSIFNSNSAMLD